jgi:hypothetical protein
LVKFLLLAGAIFGAWAFRGPICARLADFFPSSGDKASSLATGAKPPKDKYKRVESARSDRDETLSQTSCGLAEEEIDPAAEEWAARLAAQREGREYTPNACTAVVVGGGAAGAMPACGCARGMGGGAEMPKPPAPEEDFGGFDGFGEKEGGEWGGSTDRGWEDSAQGSAVGGAGGAPATSGGGAARAAVATGGGGGTGGGGVAGGGGMGGGAAAKAAASHSAGFDVGALESVSYQAVQHALCPSSAPDPACCDLPTTFPQR